MKVFSVKGLGVKKGIVILIVLVLLSFLCWKIYQKVYTPEEGTARHRKAFSVPVEIAPIREMTVRDVVFFTGTLFPRSQFIVAPKIAGRLEKLLVNIGDLVKRNQLIAVLDDDEYVQRVDQARAELEVGKANLEESLSNLDIARREFDRAKTLRQKKIASESDLDSADAQFKAQNAKYKVALAQVIQKKAALKGAQVYLSYTKICAYWENHGNSRIIGERFVDEGSMLAPNTPIVTVLDIGSLTAVIHVIERDYSKVQVGQQAEMTTDAFPGKTFSGKIIRIAPLLKETSRQARVEIEVPNPEGLLKPGMFVRVQIEFSKHDSATVVPLKALTKRNSQQGVFLVDMKDMKAHFIPVTLGIVTDKWAEVVTPEFTGSVVTLGQHLLEEGSPVILPGTKPGSQSPRTQGDKRLSRQKKSGVRQ